MRSDRPCREPETLAAGRAKPSLRRFPSAHAALVPSPGARSPAAIRSAVTLDLRMCLPAASGLRAGGSGWPFVASPAGADGQPASGAGRDAAGKSHAGGPGRPLASPGPAAGRSVSGVRIGGAARGRAVAHCGVWKLACEFTRAAAGSPFCCWCTVWALPAMCGRDGVWPGGGLGAGWHRTCPVMAARRRYRATASSPWPPRSPASPTPTPPPSCWGHSLGGVVGLALADGGFDVSVHAVIGLGIKVAWTDEELGRARAVAHRSPAWFASRDEAAARYLRISGLAGMLAADSPAVDVGLREQDGRWRLAMDPGAFAVGAPDMAQLLARTQAPVTLARGEHDAMNTDEQLTRLGVPTVTLPGLGHNAHVQSPRLSITLLDPHRYAVDQTA